jgi:thiol-disulfide isomerase/thioredoxin
MGDTVKAKNVFVTVLAVVIVAGLGLLWLAPAASQRTPLVNLTTLHGESLSMASLRGRPVLVNFWATSCPGCIKEMPKLAELYREFAPQGLEVIGIAMAYDPPDRVVALSSDRKIPYPIALDINSELARAFGGVELTPTSLLIAPDGQVVLRESGRLDVQKVREMVAAMLTGAEAGTHPFRIQ